MAKKGFLYRLTMGRDDQPDFTVDKLPGTRWAVFKDIITQRFWALVRINLMVLLFALPAILWYVFSEISARSLGAKLPYSGNLGFGYPVAPDMLYIGQYNTMISNVYKNLILLPCLMLASVGLAGAFHVIKLLVWGEGVSITANFFKGIKSNWLPFLIVSIFIGLEIVLVNFNIDSYLLVENKVLSIIGIVVSIILLVFLAFMAMYMLTQTVTYKLKFWGLVKNSFLLSIGMLPQNIFFMFLSTAPLLLAIFFPSIGLFFSSAFYLLIGFSYTILVWTIYAHYVFDKFINDKVEGAIKDRGIYRKTAEEKKAAEERRKKAANVRFSNPKKKKPVKNIDEGKSYTPLTSTFSRSDLERLAAEKEEVKREIDAQYEEDEQAQEASEDSDANVIQKDDLDKQANDANALQKDELDD